MRISHAASRSSPPRGTALPRRQAQHPTDALTICPMWYFPILIKIINSANELVALCYVAQLGKRRGNRGASEYNRAGDLSAKKDRTCPRRSDRRPIRYKQVHTAEGHGALHARVARSSALRGLCPRRVVRSRLLGLDTALVGKTPVMPNGGPIVCHARGMQLHAIMQRRFPNGNVEPPRSPCNSHQPPTVSTSRCHAAPPDAQPRRAMTVVRKSRLRATRGVLESSL
jgi:hypothetical protein